MLMKTMIVERCYFSGCSRGGGVDVDDSNRPASELRRRRQVTKVEVVMWFRSDV
ncbi:hypothetical protein HanIR_Chr10g0466311 [Helianthus annuus]|nr:hypothetical protein HanIR_Chr10g0466311 [Helianthus annuus]